MIIWINGPFGAGKTTVARALSRLIPNAGCFDPESLGPVLESSLGALRPAADFQEWRAWRQLTATALREIASELNVDVIVPQTVLVEPYWDEIVEGLLRGGVELLAVTIDVEPAEHARRIDSDEFGADAGPWRHSHRKDYELALPWLREKTRVLDSTDLTPDEVAVEILEACGKIPLHLSIIRDPVAEL